jgi:hypothetical protein
LVADFKTFFATGFEAFEVSSGFEAFDVSLDVAAGLFVSL